MGASAQPEGKLGVAGEGAFVLQLKKGGVFDVSVHVHSDTDGTCRMAMSYFSAERLRLHLEAEGELVNDSGYRVHGVQVLSAVPEDKFKMVPHQPGGGYAIGKLLP